MEMAAHYESGVEIDRLSTWSRLEFLRTTEILRRYLPSPPAKVGDVGGGTGGYAWPLAGEGYTVHLLDPMGLHIEQAREGSSAFGDAELASAEVGDARQLPWGDQTMDVVCSSGRFITSRSPRIALRPSQKLDESCSRVVSWSLPRSPDLHPPTTDSHAGSSLSRSSVG
jgi:hypothetical protein